MRVLVTGAAGFLGRHLTEKLLARGDDVVACDIAFDPPVSGQADVFRGSVTDADAMAMAMHECDAVIHGAAITNLWAKRSATFDEVNVEGTRNVLDAALAEGITRVVHVSSFVTLINGKRGDPLKVDERMELPAEAMFGPYPRSKRAAELVCRSHPLDPVIVMPSAPIGPGDHGPTPPGQMLADLAAKRLPALIDCAWNFVPVEALANGVLAALDRGVRGRRYLLTGANMETADLVGMLAELGLEPPRFRVPHGVALVAGHLEAGISAVTGSAPKGPLTGVRLAGPRLIFDNGRARRELGFDPGDPKAAFRAALAWEAAQRSGQPFG